MPTKKSGNDGTRKSSIPAAKPNPPKPMELEIIIHDPPKSPERQHAMLETTNMERKNFLEIYPYPEEENPFADAEKELINVLRKLQELHDTACETNAAKITIERTQRSQK